MTKAQPPQRDHSSSMGQTLTEARWLDAHFEACRTEYEAIVRSVGIEKGWHILDAGCGGGSFLPLLAELVGPTGHVTAIDLAPENVTAVRDRVAMWHLPCPVTAQSGSLTALSFPDNAFDGVWCANTLMYLTDDALATALAEFRRVIRPGGRVMLKEGDMLIAINYPGDPGLRWRLYDAQIRGAGPEHGAARSRGLHWALVQAGFVAVSQWTVLKEWYAPISGVARQFLGEELAWYARCAEELGMPEADVIAWRAASDPASPTYQLDQPDFSRCEAHVVAIGTVPGSDRIAGIRESTDDT